MLSSKTLAVNVLKTWQFRDILTWILVDANYDVAESCELNDHLLNHFGFALLSGHIKVFKHEPFDEKWRASMVVNAGVHAWMESVVDEKVWNKARFAFGRAIYDQYQWRCTAHVFCSYVVASSC